MKGGCVPSGDRIPISSYSWAENSGKQRKTAGGLAVIPVLDWAKTQVFRGERLGVRCKFVEEQRKQQKMRSDIQLSAHEIPPRNEIKCVLVLTRQNCLAAVAQARRLEIVFFEGAFRQRGSG
jgi:hypothetical protein